MTTPHSSANLFTLEILIDDRPVRPVAAWWQITAGNPHVRARLVPMGEPQASPSTHTNCDGNHQCSGSVLRENPRAIGDEDAPLTLKVDK